MAVIRGTISSFDSTAWTAKVRLDGAQAQTLDSVRVARGLASAEVSAGRRCIVDTGDHGDLLDVVLTAVYT